MTRYGIVSFILLAMIFPAICSGAVVGAVYSIKYSWVSGKSVKSYHEMTRDIYRAIAVDGGLVYAEYGQLDEVQVWLAEEGDYKKLVKFVANERNNNIDLTIENIADQLSPTGRMYDGQYPKAPECQVIKKRQFNSATAVMRYLSGVQQRSLEKGYLVFLDYEGETEADFRIIFDFYANCKHQEAIVEDLLSFHISKPEGQVEECFFKAYLTRKTYSTENFDLYSQVGEEMAVKYFAGEVAYFPFATGVTQYFGGTCEQAEYWKERLRPGLKVKDITAEIFQEDFKKHQNYKGIKPPLTLPDE